MTDENFLRLEGIQQHIEDANYSDLSSTQSMQVIYEEIVNLCAWKSFAGKMLAEYKRTLNEKKVNAYQNLIASQRAVKMDIPPSIAKDYIASKCGEYQYFVDFSDRVNANCGYYIESLRSILSALKEESKMNNYAAQQGQQ